jgi:hypothetical protein
MYKLLILILLVSCQQTPKVTEIPTVVNTDTFTVHSAVHGALYFGLKVQSIVRISSTGASAHILVKQGDRTIVDDYFIRGTNDCWPVDEDSKIERIWIEPFTIIYKDGAEHQFTY